MSIDKIIGFWRKNRLLGKFFSISSLGFLLIELLVSMAILAGVMLILFKFSCNMTASDRDSIMRFKAINCIRTHLEGDFGKIGNFRKKIGNFCLYSKKSSVAFIESNLPEDIKKKLKKRFFEKYDIYASWKTESGKGRSVKIISASARRVI